MFFAVILCIYYRGDWAIVGVVAVGALVAIIAYWRDCRGSATKPARRDTHRSNSQR
ncbi:MAG TPA: hypothetical protein VGJ34_07055 [Gaiellaceae bacterium]